MNTPGEEAREVRLVPPDDRPSPPAPATEELERRVAPVERSVLWTPTTDGPLRRPVVGGALFVTQDALTRVLEHVAGSPPGAAVGLLTGGRFRDSDDGEPFVLIDASVPLPELSPTTPLGGVVGQGLMSAPERDTTVVGWYRSHVFGDAALTPGDAGVHLKFFPDESPLALVVAGSGAAGGWFRPAAGTAWQFDCLPFHEVLSDLSLRADGARPSVVGWRNYRTEDTIVRKRMSSVVSAAMPAAPAVPTASVLWPDQDERDGDAPRPPAPSLGAVLRERWRRVAYVGAAAIGALATYAAIGPRPTRNAGGVGEAAVIAPTLALERRADTLDLALGAFDLRVRLFEARQMTCNDLARGLVQLEDQWMAYNLARRGAPATLDAASLERERAAHARVDDAERRFERSGCARP